MRPLPLGDQTFPLRLAHSLDPLRLLPGLGSLEGEALAEGQRQLLGRPGPVDVAAAGGWNGVSNQAINQHGEESQSPEFPGMIWLDPGL